MRTVAPIGLALLLCAPCAALGDPLIHISIAGVRSDPGAAVATQLSRALCRPPHACVPAQEVRRGGKLDFAAAKARGVDGILFGTVAGSGGRRHLELALLTTSLTPRRTWRLEMDGSGRLSGAALAAVGDDLRAELAPTPPRPAPGAAASPAPSPRAAPAKAAASASTPPVAAASPSPVARELGRASGAVAVGTAGVPPAAGPLPGGPVPRTPSPPSPEAATPRSAVRFATVDLGVDVTRRTLTYEGTGGRPLGFSAEGIVSPAARVEVSPLAGSPDHWYAGLTAFGAYAHSVGFQTESAGTFYDTAYSRLELGAGLRFRPVPSARTTLLAWGAYRTLAVKVSPQGAIAALPDVDLAGPSVGLQLEAPFASRWAFIASGAYTWWLQAKDLVGDGFFPEGSAWGVDASAGLAVNLWASVALRVTVDYAMTRYDLSGSSAYAATGATDSYLGGRAVMRIGF